MARPTWRSKDLGGLMNSVIAAERYRQVGNMQVQNVNEKTRPSFGQVFRAFPVVACGAFPRRAGGLAVSWCILLYQLWGYYFLSMGLLIEANNDINCQACLYNAVGKNR